MNDIGLRHLGRREAAVAVAVACLLVFVSWLFSKATGGDENAPDGAVFTPQDSIFDIDISSAVTADDIQKCLTDSFATSTADVEIRYAELQKSERGDVPVLILSNEHGDLRLCDSFGGDAPSVSPIDYADQSHPVTLVSNGRQAWDCAGTRLSGYSISHWLSVDSEVAKVQMRFVVNGSSSPWFSSAAQNGFVHLHAWLTDQDAGSSLLVQVRVLDSSDDLVRQSAFSTDPQLMTGCENGSIDIG